MSKSLFQNPNDFFIEVAVCSLKSFLNLNPFEVVASEENRTKIEQVLEIAKSSKFILFPEYTYSDDWQQIFQTFCDQTNNIIIGGTGLESAGDKFYAYSPVFFPRTEMQRVYKTHITHSEILYSNDRIIPYPNPIQRHINVIIDDDDNEIIISIYVCYDFIQECAMQQTRSDIIFVPQYEQSPEMFINEGDRCSKGESNFVLGANNANDGLRSYGFATLNNNVISALSGMDLRAPNYKDSGGRFLNHHHTIFYDTEGEKLLKFKLNIGRPYSLQFTYRARAESKPVIIPIANIDL